MSKLKERTRLMIQLLFTALTNGYINGFLGQKLYKGNLKQFCVPGLNCYSCPGALGSCPIGALQAVASDRTRSVSMYVLGFIAIIGALIGRGVCGLLCPFGLVHDLMYKIPVPKILRRIPGDQCLRYIKYILYCIQWVFYCNLTQHSARISHRYHIVCKNFSNISHLYISILYLSSINI